MPLKAGIVGLPNVGKSTLFNAVTSAQALVANYPFATIEPNVGTVYVPDERLPRVAELIGSKKAVPTAIEIIDIAGLVKGASQGEGLGNRFLSHIRDVDAIVHVVRCFHDANVSHVTGMTDPIADVDIVDAELAIADLDIALKRMPKIEKKARLKVDKDAVSEYAILARVKDTLEAGRPIRELDVTPHERRLLKGFGFLTYKPVLYVANVDENDLEGDNPLVEAVCAHAKKTGGETVVLSARLEHDLGELDEEDRAEFIAELGVSESGIASLIARTYTLLGLQTFFTADEKEARAYAFTDGMTARQCAGLVHSDFEKGFIRAETISADELFSLESMAKAKEIGKVRLEGKDYRVQDGDVMWFRFNV